MPNQATNTTTGNWRARYASEFYDAQGRQWRVEVIDSITTNLAADGINVVPYGQGFVSMSTPSKELERLMSEFKVQHDGDPVMRWMFGNVVLRMDASGNIKPDKEKSGDKIDGIVSLIMSIGQAMTDQSKPQTSIPNNYTIRTL